MLTEIKTKRGSTEKYWSIGTKGFDAAQAGGYKEFTGFTDALRNRMNASVSFTQGSDAQVSARIASIIAREGGELGMDFLLAGQDFPIHSTLLEGLIPDSDQPQRENVLNQAREGVNRLPQVTGVVGQSLVFDDLLVDGGGSVILVAKDIPTAIKDARAALANDYQTRGLGSVFSGTTLHTAMNDILHISLARPRKIPAGVQEKYYDVLAKLGIEVGRNPLSLQIAQVFTGSAWDLLNPR